MKSPILFMLMGFVLCMLFGCQSTPENVSTPDNTRAHIEGISMAASLFSPSIKLNYPGLIAFDIEEVDGQRIGAFSGGGADVSAGEHTLSISGNSQYTNLTYSNLKFTAEAGKTYLLRPVVRNRGVFAVLADKATGKIIAESE